MKRFATERVTGLMERLGLDDDVAIESRLVSKTIECAQSRVEGFNFDIRKRVVEFDDVINKQRETIYAERDKVLHNEDLTETVQAFLDEEIDVLVETDLVGDDPHEWNLEGLSSRAPRDGPDRRGHDAPTSCGSSAAARRSPSTSATSPTTRSTAKAAEVGEEDWAMVERLVLLRTIDSLWVEHLTELDDMRRGIGLRGYAQQDPLNEFRREAFRLYEELRGLIRHGVASSIFRVTVTRQPPPRPRAAIRPWPRRSPAARRRSPAATATDGGPPRRGPRAGGRRGSRPAPRSAVPRSCAAARRRHRPRGRCAKSLGDQPVAGGGGPVGERPAPGFTPSGRPDRAQRPVLVRLGREVQEVPRALTPVDVGRRSATRRCTDRSLAT